MLVSPKSIVSNRTTPWPHLVPGGTWLPSPVFVSVHNTINTLTSACDSCETVCIRYRSYGRSSSILTFYPQAWLLYPSICMQVFVCAWVCFSIYWMNKRRRQRRRRRCQWWRIFNIQTVNLFIWLSLPERFARIESTICLWGKWVDRYARYALRSSWRTSMSVLLRSNHT